MKYFILIISVFMGLQSPAQTTTFLNSGTITYERSVNMYPVLNRIMSADGKRDAATTATYVASVKANVKQFSKRNFKMQFTANQSFYYPEDASKMENNFIIDMAANINEVYNEVSAGKRTQGKTAFGKKYVITDSLLKFKWRFTGETRDIAGYPCYRANGLLADSIYVVAFFSPQIPCASGPESFNGLPGMILGVSLPYEHISWFATKVEATVIPIDKWDLPSDKKMITDTEFRKSMNSFLDNIGENNGGSWFRQFMFY